MPRRHLLRTLAAGLLLASAFFSSAIAQAQPKIGVLMLHGKSPAATTTPT